MEIGDLRFLLSLIYIIPTYGLYGCLFYTIFFCSSKKKFSQSFYILFGLSTVYYVLYSSSYHIDFRFPKTPFLIPFVKIWGVRGFTVTVIHLLSWYFAHATHLLNCLLAFNRASVFALKTEYQHFWKKYLKYFLAIPILFPILLIWHIPFSEVYVKLEYENDPEGIRYLTEGNKKAVPWMDNPRNSAILITFTSILSMGMNGYVIVKLMQQKYCSTNVQHGKVAPQDIKMSIYTLLIFGTDIASCAFLYVLETATNFDFIISMLNIQVYLVDITTLAPAWFVLVTNKTLRKQIISYFKITKFTQHQQENSVAAVGTVITSARLQSPQIRVISN